MLKSVLTSLDMQRVLLGQIRHLVTASGAALATNGIIGTSDVETYTGAVMVLASLILSAISKKIA